MTKFQDPAVSAKFQAYPPNARQKLLELRKLIVETAAETNGVGELEEVLKWGEPAYLTSKSGSGSTIRIDWKKAKPGQCAMYFNCKTDLVDTFRTIFPNELKFEGSRAIILEVAEPVPTDILRICISAALTYHKSKARNTTPAP